MWKRIREILIFIDKGINYFILFGKWETISMRAARNRGKSILADGVCWLTDKVDKDHCDETRQ